jgi:nucleoside phosphorylase
VGKPGRVGIVAALAAEARTLGAVPPREQFALLPDGSLLAVSGMGFEAAEHDARALIDAGCNALVSWGLAGGLDPRVSPGAVLVPEVSMLEGAPDLSTSSTWRTRVLASIPAAAGGRLLTSKRAIGSAAEKRAAFLQSGAVAVDMESYAIAAVAEAHRLPFIALRVVVDAADDEVPAILVNVAGPGGRLAVGRLVMRLLASPRSLKPLRRLAQRYRIARRSLRAAARAGAPGPAPDRTPAS